MNTKIDNGADILDSRDIIARIDELKAAWDEATEDDHTTYHLSEDDWAAGLGEEDAHELVTLLEFAEEASGYAPDWEHGETLIRDSYFTEYAQEMAEDIGAINPEASWPTYCIDWERAAADLRMDYSSAELDGVTYWFRS